MNQKKYVLVTALLFPAFMGAWLYEASNIIFAAFTTSIYPDLTQIVLSAVLLSHYIVDYLYTFQTGPKEYSKKHFVIDMAILICLYVGLKISIAPDYDALILGVWTALLVMKLFAVAWNLLEKDYRNAKSDLAFLLVYAFSMCFWPNIIWLLITICFIDTIVYEVNATQKVKNT